MGRPFSSGVSRRFSLLPFLFLVQIISSADADDLPTDARALRAAIDHLSVVFEERYPDRDEFLARLDAIERQAHSTDAPDSLHRFEGQLQTLQREALVESNPLVDFEELLLIRRDQVMGGSHYAYTEAVSWARDRERHFHPGAALCRIALKDTDAEPRVLVDSRTGVIRDPDVHWDGSKVLYSHKKSLDADDYHLYEYDLDTGSGAQLTHDAGFADYEGCYLPDDWIAFSSTRCVQTVPCWKTPVSNLYKMDRDGSKIHRISYNHVHDNFPTILNDGRILYTRWEYNDRGQLWLQGLFAMNPDGTGCSAYYGNNSFWPVTMIHARAIPGTSKIVTTLCGHHTDQTGEIGIFDIGLGYEEAGGCIQLWPERPLEPIHVELYTRDLKTRFLYPYPLSENFILTACKPEGRDRFGIYLIDTFGNQVLIYEDPKTHCFSPMPLRPRERPRAAPSRVRHEESEGTVFLADVYRGAGLRGIERGAVKSLRIVEVIFRPFGSHNGLLAEGPGGRGGLFPAMGLKSSWDAKRVIGTVPVEEDGSALFRVPANRPIYFQPLDKDGKALHTMRSWTTVMPGDVVSCVGCHEPKREAPGNVPALALGKPRRPSTHLDTDRPFAFHRDVQPVLDRHCIQCHDMDHADGIDLRADKTDAFSLAYENLLPFVRTLGAQDVPVEVTPKSSGAIVSPLIDILENGHHDVQLNTEEMDRLITWIDINGNYYGSYALTRPRGHLGRCVVETPAPLFEALGEDCLDCHEAAFNWRPTENRYETSRSSLVNLTHPEQSRLLRAPLAKEAGGLGVHETDPFQDRDDPRYAASLEVIRSWAQELRKYPREDMPGAKTTRDYFVWLNKRRESLAIEERNRAILLTEE